MNAKEFAHELEKAASFIRQQQNEIEKLKNLVEVQDEKIIDLAFRAVYAERGAEVVAELYTHPVKELTDEEIAGAVARGWCSEKNSMKVMDSDLAWAIVEEIKAILRKAQEK